MSRTLNFLLAGLVAFCAHPAADAVQRSLDDTGATTCIDPATSQATSDCKGSGQDADQGRDAEHPGDADGHAGFKFRKIALDGSPLPRKATSWGCVEDVVTGLVWEVKTDDGSIRDKDVFFTNKPSPAGRPRGDAQNYVDKMNSVGLCGATDWRLPTLEELTSIVDTSALPSQPMIDTEWFPNSLEDWYWTSTRAGVSVPQEHWVVQFIPVAAGDHFQPSGSKVAVRLVHGARIAFRLDRLILENEETTDPVTNLNWRRCSEGQIWDGQTCTGSPTYMTFLQTFDRAKSEAALSGKAWRVPNIKELASIAARQEDEKALSDVIFPNTPFLLNTWSSTPSAADVTRAWSLQWSLGYSGNVSHLTDGGALRLVRDGEGRR